MRSIEERERVAELIAEGLNDCEVARRSGVPRSTIREWRRHPHPRGWPQRPLEDPCVAELAAADYAYLLGIYLGDGHIARAARGGSRLRIYLDNVYPAIILESARTLERLFPQRRVSIRHHPTCNMVIVSMYARSWGDLLPHGPGMKHTRRIELTDWQSDFVEREPGRFLRGLIHSDGWRGENRVRSPAGKQYSYPRYQFANRSEDIKHLFCHACHLLGVEWRVMNAMNISVARRDSVAILDQYVGPKG